MNYKPEPLEKGCLYHVYNRGNNGINIFYEPENYYYFLKLYDQYICPIAETYAWCLLKNHFHALIYVKNENEIASEEFKYSTVELPRVKDASRQFSHFFNAYTQAINKRYHRTGSLFEKPFKRKRITSKKYFCKLVFYIHNNPVRHGFVEKPIAYPWSSYEHILSNDPTKTCREYVLSQFGDRLRYTNFHSDKQDLSEINKFIIE